MAERDLKGHRGSSKHAEASSTLHARAPRTCACSTLGDIGGRPRGTPTTTARATAQHAACSGAPAVHTAANGHRSIRGPAAAAAACSSARRCPRRSWPSPAGRVCCSICTAGCATPRSVATLMPLLITTGAASTGTAGTPPEAPPDAGQCALALPPGGARERSPSVAPLTPAEPCMGPTGPSNMPIAALSVAHSAR